jgi:hypothetical protein
MSRSTGESAIVCQGETWHIMLGTRVFRWTGLFRAGIVGCERKGEQARDLQIADVLRGKGANITLYATYRFRSPTERSAGYSGSAQKPLLKGGTWESE